MKSIEVLSELLHTDAGDKGDLMQKLREFLMLIATFSGTLTEVSFINKSRSSNSDAAVQSKAAHLCSVAQAFP